MRFRDRRDAGRQLAHRLVPRWKTSPNEPIVLALPRGGVPVAAELASELGGTVEVFVARKIGAPGQPEYGIGAIAEGNDEVIVTGDIAALGLDVDEMEKLAAAERAELNRRVQLYRAGQPLPPLAGRDVVLVDDGLATGVTAEAALRALDTQAPRRLVLAVPVCSPTTRDRLAAIADEVICLAAPSQFRAIGAWYENFEQTTDSEVLQLLEQTQRAA